MEFFHEDHTMYGGTLRIKNPKTLRRWKRNGEYQKLIDSGLIYAKNCGRFRETICTCSRCNRGRKSSDNIDSK